MDKFPGLAGLRGCQTESVSKPASALKFPALTTAKLFSKADTQ